ncbi:MAG: STAS domain-containing protein [Bryobacteraceae bacterium]|nr:STAS domain-containing protein [Bryobacteraceae bacterium]
MTSRITPESRSEARDRLDLAPIRLVESEAEILIRLCGAVDIGASEAVLDAARQAASSTKAVRLDWSEADHVDLSALQIVLALDAALATDGRALEIGEMPPRVRQHVASAGLAEILDRSRR